MITTRATNFIQFSQGSLELLERGVVVKFTLDKTNSLAELVPHVLIKGSTAVCLDGGLDFGCEIFVVPGAAGKTHQRETGW